MMPAWLTVTRRAAPLLVSIPHTGTDLAGLEPRLASDWLGRRDADWWIDRLYDFAGGLGATVVHTAISRTVIDVNRDPSGASLYPGQATTGLCPTETFDGDPLYRAGGEPGPEEIDERRRTYFEPYHVALAGEIERLRALHPKIVLYDCHSIRSVIPAAVRWAGCRCSTSAPIPATAPTRCCWKSRSPTSWPLPGETQIVVNGRFKGGWITRHLRQSGSMASMPCRWNSPAVVTCWSRIGQGRIRRYLAEPRMTRILLRRCARH